MTAVTVHSDFEALTVSIVSPSTCHEMMGLDAMIFIFGMLSFKPAFSLSSFTFIKRLFSSSLLSAIRVVSSASEAIDISACNAGDLGSIPGLGRYPGEEKDYPL